MSCNTCFTAQPLPHCIDELILGTVAINLPVIVIFTAPGNVFEINTTTNGAGLITLDLTDIELMESVYKIEVYSAADISTPLNITFANGDIFNCAEIGFRDGIIDSGIVNPRA